MVIPASGTPMLSERGATLRGRDCFALDATQAACEYSDAT